MSGQRLWAARYGGTGSDVGEAVAVSPDGTRVYVAATSGNGRVSCGGDVEGTDYATIAYDAFTGARVWAARYSGLAPQHPDAPGDVAVSPDGALVFVSGISDDGCNASDVATLSYEAQLTYR
jgi:DNA-binding beta-propeller fold protein YncE